MESIAIDFACKSRILNWLQTKSLAILYRLVILSAYLYH